MAPSASIESACFMCMCARWLEDEDRGHWRCCGASNCLRSMCAGPWLNRVYKAASWRLSCSTIVVPFLIPSFNKEIFPQHFTTAVRGASVSSIHPANCPPNAKTAFSSILFGSFRKINNWKHTVLRASQTDSMFHLRTPRYVSLTPRARLPQPSWGLDLVFVQYRGLELRALVNAPPEEINFSWMSPWCFERQPGAARVVGLQQPIKKRNNDVPQDNTMQIHQDFVSDFYFILNKFSNPRSAPVLTNNTEPDKRHSKLIFNFFKK